MISTIDDNVSIVDIHNDAGALAVALNKRLIWDTDTDWNKGTLGEDTEVSGTGISAVICPKSVSVLNTYLTWHLNETEGSIVTDSSINHRDGVIVTAEGFNPIQFVAGKLNGAFSWPGEFEAMDCINGGDVANFEWTDSFSFDTWITLTPYEILAVAQKYDEIAQKGWVCQIQSGYPSLFLFGNNADNFIQVYSDIIIPVDYAYHHIAVTYDGSGLASGIKFYVDGVLAGNNVYWDSLSEVSISNTANFIVGGAVNRGAGFIGQLDEFSVYSRVLSQENIDFRYNSGVGTESSFETLPKYRTTAHYETNIFDSMFLDNIWRTFDLSEIVPNGTTVEVKARVSNNLSNMGEYGLPLTIGSSIGLTGQFIQFSVDFTGTEDIRSLVDYIAVRFIIPTLQDVTP